MIGDAKTGKTKWINNILGTDDDKYVPTIGVNVFPIEIENIKLNIWETAGNIKYGGLMEG